ncbi:hypothetical protein SAMN05216480_12310 [Pustulibacterium marinum]|uniref:Uncharacterized protein n=1 Tax=Pustulibacterium marinum TaxID=1224947 RepID=A0A1I7IW00_9FLAO|nr:hypothetical protein SAMN05216480_12310 [Pustulibacterium marinum]
MNNLTRIIIASAVSTLVTYAVNKAIDKTLNTNNDE